MAGFDHALRGTLLSTSRIRHRDQCEEQSEQRALMGVMTSCAKERVEIAILAAGEDQVSDCREP